MNTIQAIETRYAGVLFRSRLEARWAVYFDAIGMPWEYEPDTYRIPNGELYLPDFRLPYFFAEVKPDGDSFVKARASGLNIALLDGMPESRVYTVLFPGEPVKGLVRAAAYIGHDYLLFDADTRELPLMYPGLFGNRLMKDALQLARSARFGAHDSVNMPGFLTVADRLERYGLIDPDSAGELECLARRCRNVRDLNALGGVMFNRAHECGICGICTGGCEVSAAMHKGNCAYITARMRFGMDTSCDCPQCA